LLLAVVAVVVTVPGVETCLLAVVVDITELVVLAQLGKVITVVAAQQTVVVPAEVLVLQVLLLLFMVGLVPQAVQA
jgi:hypothetical protein